MKKQIVLILLLLCGILKAQDHVIGMGAGYSSFEPPIYLSYQFSYKCLNSKAKLSLLPFGRYTNSWSLSNDYFIGVKTKENKKNILSLNIGVSFLYPKKDKYESDIKQQINPIVNLSYSYCFNENHRITSDFSLSQYTVILGRYYTYNTIDLIIFEIGYAYKFKKKIKKTNPETP